MTQKKTCWLKKAACIGLGVTAAAAGAAAVCAALGLRRWARDPYAQELKLPLCGKYGVRIRKGEPCGNYLLDLRYDWRSDPDLREPEDEAEQDAVMEIHLPDEPVEDEEAGGGGEA